MELHTEWSVPQPRRGIGGLLDRFIGPGATRAEILLQFIPAFLFGIGVIFYASAHDLPWLWYEYAAAALLGVDVIGGIITNATSAGKRWYHRKGQGFNQHFTFVLIHIAQILVVSGLFMEWNLQFIAYTYAYLVASALIILSVPLYLQRPAALLALAGGILLSIYTIPAAQGLEWFAPLLFIKLLISHLLSDTPVQAKG